MEAVAGGVTAPVFAHGERELNYICRFKRNIKDLGDNIAALEANRKDVRSRVDAARNNNHLIRKTVDTWLEQADRLFEEATQLKSEAGDINSWWKGWVTCSRFCLGRKAAKKNVDIQKHLEEKFDENNLSDPRPIQSYEPEPDGDFKTFASREATKSEVIAALKNDKISLVGIFGMPGVGKTMLMQAVMAQVKKEKVFDEVVMVVVSQKPVLETIQDAIAEKLDLKFKGKSIRAEELRERLNQERKTLLCLDDVWERMELVEVGIPYKNAGNRCKVIFTTRNQGECERMEMDKKIEVKVLSEVDSWDLFRSKAGSVVDSSVFETVAGNIVKEFKGLPLAIVTLGLALRNKDDIAVWDDTLARLQTSIYDEKMERVNASIRLSYDFLKDETTKMCFLFCCMFPEDCQIPTDVLFGYMMGEKLIRNVDTFEQARNRLQATVEKLTSAGLLLKGDYGRIMMHDVVRDVAVSIACEETNEFIVKAKISFDEWSDMELEKCKRLSLMDKNIRYPSQIKAPNLLTLSLNNFNDLHEFPFKYFHDLFFFSSLNEIPSNFFQEMTNLLTLDLSNTNIRSLPTSLSSLTNLRTLHLNNCSELKNISPVVKLNRLEILCLNESGIEIFPEEMGSLTCLKSLNFLRTKPPYTTISPKVISRLLRLEEFSGNYIENLQFSSENDSSPWKKITRFKISLGKYDISHLRDIRQMERTEFRRSLILTLSSISISHLIQVLLPKTMLLYLKCKGIENVLQLDKIVPNLRMLAVDNCGKLITLIPESVRDDVGDGVEQGSSSTRLCYSPPSRIFHNLTHLAITNCPKLKHLFPLRVFQLLSKLEMMVVQNCSALEILFRDDSDIESGDLERDKASHHLLKAFVLLGLPKLSSFSGSDSLVVDWPSAKSLTVKGCPNLKRLPLGTHSVPKLETFTISDQEWFNKLEWDDQRIKAELQTLLVLEVKC
ncbi:hypothetical protein IFM89_021904 [Coptis chinensis]|uniref:AAA+ ATPase domain-containing protein n=1 Tax=Coptis chinensis TaxID=261450 RepID=A0A835LNE7_9MAGN|nr:hypothetical protein IFM89_021904 [Coptis chinensis]